MVKLPEPFFCLTMPTQKSLQRIFAELPAPFTLDNVPDVQINGISIDSRTVKSGHLFVAMTGGTLDGHNYVQSAIDKGAVAVIGEKDITGCW